QDATGEAKPAAPTAGKAPVAGAAPVVHRGSGTVESVDPAQASVTIAHGPIASLKWPAMSMEFKVKDAALLRAMKPGQKIDFETVAGVPGEYVIVRVQPATESKPAADAHQGH
ncbi:MAG: copper-binding protein, partial [Betaproteobacteria bacterium]|nr:copper-binding protein [Betaproteobacteria bacterium]